MCLMFFFQIIASIAFGLLSIGVCAAVGVISYEAIDWDLDDYGDGDGKVDNNFDNSLRSGHKGQLNSRLNSIKYFYLDIKMSEGS